MGYSMTPYAVDLGKITALLGSKDKPLLRLLCKKFEEEFDNIDALGDDYVEDDEEDEEREEKGPRGGMSLEEAFLKMRDLLLNQDSPQNAARDDKPRNEKADAEERPPCPSTADALRHLVMGEPWDRRIGFKYGYVLESLCRHFGERLPNDNWCDLRSCHNWFEELDDTLRLAGVPAETLSIGAHLRGRGSPVPIPKYRDFPCIGYLRADEIRRALEALSKAKIDDVGDDEEGEPWLPEGLDDVRRWLRTCAESNRELISFYY